MRRSRSRPPSCPSATCWAIRRRTMPPRSSVPPRRGSTATTTRRGRRRFSKSARPVSREPENTAFLPHAWLPSYSPCPLENAMKLLCQLAVTTVLASASALAVAAGSAPQPLAQPQKLTLGNVKVGHLSPMLFMAEDLKQCNVTVESAEFVRYADARTALLSGSVDVVGIGPAD